MDLSEDDNYVFLGTSLPQYEEDEVVIRKPVAVHEQVVRDEQGRVRFHGAFTGGFSAGYFNTVDTKEGWTPQTFRSSRNERAGLSQQKPEDFMDDEDVGEFGIAPRSLKTTQVFSTRQEATTTRHEATTTSTRHEATATELQLARMRIGTRMLRRMGWRRGEGVGEVRKRKKKMEPHRVYGCSLPPQLLTSLTPQEEEDEDDDDDDNELRCEDMCKVAFATKIDNHGIGYRGMSVGSAGKGGLGSAGKGGLGSAGKGGLGSASNKPPKDALKRGAMIKGQGFGTGALEDEDEDVYDNDNIHNCQLLLAHEEEEDELYGWTAPKHHHDLKTKNTLKGFKKSSSSSSSHLKVYEAPDLPRNFQPFRALEDTPTDNILHKSHQPHPRRNAEYYMNRHHRRAEVLGEKLQLNSVFDLVNEDGKARIETTKQDIEKKKEPRRHTTRWGQTDDKTDKHTKHKEELVKTPLKEDISKMDTSGLTEWERDAARPLSDLMACRFVKETGLAGAEVKEEKVGVGRVSSVEWHPAKLVCVRFNVEDPFPDSQVVGLLTSKPVKPSFFDFKTPISVVIGKQQIIDSPSNITNNKPLEVKEARESKQEVRREERRNADLKPLSVLSSVDLRTPTPSSDLALNLIPPDQPFTTSNTTTTINTPTQSPKQKSIAQRFDSSTSEGVVKDLGSGGVVEELGSGGVVEELDSGGVVEETKKLKPSIDVFKSIFESSEDEDDEEEQHTNDKNHSFSPTITVLTSTITVLTSTITTTDNTYSHAFSTPTNKSTSTTTTITPIIIEDDNEKLPMHQMVGRITSKVPLEGHLKAVLGKRGDSKLSEDDVWVESGKKSKQKKHKHKKEKKMKKKKHRDEEKAMSARGARNMSSCAFSECTP